MGNIQKGVGVVGNNNYIGRLKYAYFKYDFAALGGAVSAITLTGDTIPSGAVVTDSYLLVDTLVTGGAGATVSLGVESATDLRAAATLTTAPALDTTGVRHFSAHTAVTAPIVTTAARQVVATVAVNALTAGVFRVVVAYVEVAA